MADALSRTRMLLGEHALEKLAGARVAVFGIGGVGGYVCEALVRAGIGAFDLIDADQISLTNLNRQIIALRSTLGRDKAEVMRERMLDIRPDTEIRTRKVFVLPDNIGDFPFETYDYAVDAVDTVAAKLAIIQRARETGVPVISCMGTGNKLDGSRFRVSDISETRICPLARVMRRELARRGITGVKAVWSDEEPLSPDGTEAPPPGRRSVPGSVSFVPSAAGLLIAGEVIRDLSR